MFICIDMAMKEEPNTKYYFDGKIARVVFKEDVERKVYWVDTSGIYFHLLHLLRSHLHHYYDHLRLPIEEWLKEQGMACVEDDMCLFAMRWG